MTHPPGGPLPDATGAEIVYPPCVPFVFCDACRRDDDWVNQFHCRFCGKPVKKRLV